MVMYYGFSNPGAVGGSRTAERGFHAMFNVGRALRICELHSENGGIVIAIQGSLSAVWKVLALSVMLVTFKCLFNIRSRTLLSRHP